MIVCVIVCDGDVSFFYCCPSTRAHSLLAMRVAVCCSMSLRVAFGCHPHQHLLSCCSVLQRVAMCCSMLQYTVEWCDTILTTTLPTSPSHPHPHPGAVGARRQTVCAQRVPCASRRPSYAASVRAAALWRLRCVWPSLYVSDLFVRVFVIFYNL